MMNKLELEEILEFAKKFKLMNRPFVNVYNIFVDYRDLSERTFYKRYPKMKKNLLLVLALLSCNSVFSEVKLDSISLPEVTVASVYRNGINVGSYLSSETIKFKNYGQEPSHILATYPGIYAYGDNGTQFGYNYFRLRGLGQERVNYTIDGLPIIQESEDFGCYFSNLPDLMSSLGSVKIEKGAGVGNNGSVAYAGSISFESIDPTKKNSYVDMGYGNFNTSRITGVYNSGSIGKWSFHLRGTMLETDGYKEYSGNKSKALTSKIQYKINDKNSIDFLTINGYHKNGQSFMGLEKLPDHLDPFGTIPNGNDRRETDNFFLSVNKVQYKGWVGNNNLILGSVYYSKMLGDYRMCYDGLWNYNLNHNLYGANLTMKNWVGDFSFTTNINAQRFQRRHKGFELPEDTIVDHFKEGNLKPAYNNLGKKDDINVSEKIKYTYNKFSVQANIQTRYAELNYDVSKGNNNLDTPFNASWFFVNTGLNIWYDFKEGSKVYLGWSTVGKEPSRTDILGGEFNTGEFAVSDPECSERVHDVELGWEYVSKKFQANINYYYMNFKNELVATGLLSEQNGLPLHQPLRGYRTGIETSLTWLPISGLKLTENISYSRNKLKKYHTHPYSPSVIHYTSAEYMKNKYMVGLNLSGHSKMYVDLDNKFSLPYTLSLGGYFGYKFSKRVEVKLDLNNITNRLNTSNGSTDGEKLYYNIDSPFSMFLNVRIGL